MVKHPLSVSLLTQGVATLWGLKVWEHIKNMKYFHLNLEIIWNLWELRNISSDMWKMEDCGSHQRGSGFKPKQVHLCEVCMFINGKCTYLNHSLPRSHHCSIPAQYFLSLDSSRADFMIHSLKYVFLFCFVFSSTLVQPWVHAFSETSARSHVDEQQNTLFLCVHEHKSLQCVSNVFRNEAFFIILSRQSGDVLPQQPINPYNKPKKWLPLYYNKKHEIFLTLSSDFNA